MEHPFNVNSGDFLQYSTAVPFVFLEPEMVTNYPDFLFLTITNIHAYTTFNNIMKKKNIAKLTIFKEKHSVYLIDRTNCITVYMYLPKSDSYTTAPPSGSQ